MTKIQNNEDIEKQWQSIYLLGGTSTVIVLMGIIADIFIGSTLGTNISINAVGVFGQLQANMLRGLYNLDLLNVINQILLIPTYFALYAAQQKECSSYALLALIIFIIGTTIFIGNNAALPMLELSNKYMSSATEAQKVVFEAAGEAVLAKGAHGSLGVFIGFVLPTMAGIIMSFAMLNGNAFGKITAYIGAVGGLLMLVYIVLVTFVAEVGHMAQIFAAPGGILIMIWMILITVRLFKLWRLKNS